MSCREQTGDPKACRLTLGKMSDEDKAFLGAVFQALLKDPNASKTIVQKTDITGLMDRLEIPETDLVSGAYIDLLDI